MTVPNYFTVVNANGGVIMRGQIPQMPEGETPPDPAVVYGAIGDVIPLYAPDDTYWDGTEFAPLQDFDDTNTLSAVTWDTDHYEFSYGSALPNPTYVHVACDNQSFISLGGEFEEVTDGTMNIESEAAGNYTIRLRADGYAEKILEVTAP